MLWKYDGFYSPFIDEKKEMLIKSSVTADRTLGVGSGQDGRSGVPACEVGVLMGHSPSAVPERQPCGRRSSRPFTTLGPSGADHSLQRTVHCDS